MTEIYKTISRYFRKRFIVPKYTYSIIFSLIMSVICLGLVISLKHFPVFSIHYLYVVHFVCSLIFTADLWIIFVILDGKYIKNKQMTPVTDRSPAEPHLIDYIKAKVNSSVFFVGRNSRATERDFENSYFTRFGIYTYNTTKLFSTLTIDGLPHLKIFFIYLSVTTLISWIIALVIIKNKLKFFCMIKLFKEVCNVAISMPYLFVHWVISLMFMLSVIIHFIVVRIHLSTINKPIVDKRGFVEYVAYNFQFSSDHSLILVFLSFYFWCFFIYLNQYCITKLVTTYLFHRARHGNLSSPNRYSLTLAPVFELFKYHIGTIALGAVVIPLCEINLFLFEIIPIKLKNFDKSKNKFVDLCVKTLEYCKKVNSNTVICAAIYGHDFHDSTEHAYNLLKKNSVHLLDLNHTIILFVLAITISFFITPLVIVLCYFGLLLFPDKLPYELPTIPRYVGMFSLILAQCTFGLLRCVMNVLIICYCDDLERNNGNNKPYYTSITIQSSISDCLSKIKYLNNLRKVFPETKKEQSKEHKNFNNGTNAGGTKLADVQTDILKIIHTSVLVQKKKNELDSPELDTQVLSDKKYSNV